MPKKIDRNYVSDIDKFLQNFDEQQSEKTASQQAEIDKHARLSDLRDGVESNNTEGGKKEPDNNSNSSNKAIWDEF